MKPSTKARVISKLNEIKTIIEKCGGAGGTPGPCPTGGGVVMTHEVAHAASTSAHSASVKASGKSGDGYKHARAALKASTSKNHSQTAAHHLSAARFHTSMAEQHSQKAEELKMHGEGGGALRKEIMKNMNAAKHHEAASSAHREAVEAHKKLSKKE